MHDSTNTIDAGYSKLEVSFQFIYRAKLENVFSRRKFISLVKKYDYPTGVFSNDISFNKLRDSESKFVEILSTRNFTLFLKGVLNEQLGPGNNNILYFTTTVAYNKLFTISARCVLGAS